ncbi:MAG: hypothetical protein M1832_004777 [Thelocarpon impressellum]|nr:MAG: hypothetical protein M1832_004777 [Thelocarpon impressellum]
MSSDDAYASFLDQANQDTGTGKASTRSGHAATKAVDTEVPAALRSVDQYYTSDTDEPMEPHLPKHRHVTAADEASCGTERLTCVRAGADEFKALVGFAGEVSTIERKEWDGRDAYGAVVESIKKTASTREEPRVYRLQHDSTRAEYFVVAVDARHSRLVGLRMRAVES